METIESIGQVLNGWEKRDAVHMAICPTIAGEALSPGDSVQIGRDGEAFKVSKEGWQRIGVVDPFLTISIAKGQRFWLFLLPGSITSLRHEWTHPNFPAEQRPAGDSEQWLRIYADGLGVTYEELMSAGEYDGCFSTDIDFDRAVHPEFWQHFANVGGKRQHPEYTPTEFFRCAC